VRFADVTCEAQDLAELSIRVRRHLRRHVCGSAPGKLGRDLKGRYLTSGRAATGIGMALTQAADQQSDHHGRCYRPRMNCAGYVQGMLPLLRFVRLPPPLPALPVRAAS